MSGRLGYTWRSAALLACVAGASACVGGQTRPSVATPAGNPVVAGKEGVAEHAMVVTAHPLASEAGVEMLRAGGNAVDAAVAAAFAVGVVEPMMSGLGGGGGMLIWSQPSGRADYVDFYASAPAAPDLSLREYEGTWANPRGVAVPGLVAGLLAAHERFGRLSREQVLAPAIRLAANGFPVHAMLARAIADDSAKLTRNPAAQRLFWPEFRPLRAGEQLVQPTLARTLRRVAREGRDGFYTGEAARAVVEVLNAGGNPITLEDLDAVRARWKRPVCGAYRGSLVLSAPPPQSGIQIVETLNLLEPYDLAALGLPTRSPAAFTLLTSALRTSTADRNAYVGDPAHSRIPITAMSSQGFADSRGVAPNGHPPHRVTPGDLSNVPQARVEPACDVVEPYQTEDSSPDLAAASDDPDELRGGETTHLSVVDAQGNAVSVTITHGSLFGTGAFAAGTFLNTAMFMFSPDADNVDALGPNRVPRSTTTPTILLRDGQVQMVVGSPGGGRIPPAVVQSIIYSLDYGLDPLTALRMPRLNPFFSSPTVQFEQGVGGDVLRTAAELGYMLEVYPPLSLHFGGVHLIERRDGHWIGAADPRRDGAVRGY